MTLATLQRQLNKEGFSPRIYSIDPLLIDGPLKDGRYCVSRCPDGWKTYYLERGLHIEERRYASEADACQGFLVWLRSLPPEFTRTAWIRTAADAKYDFPTLTTDQVFNKLEVEIQSSVVPEGDRPKALALLRDVRSASGTAEYPDRLKEFLDFVSVQNFDVIVPYVARLTVSLPNLGTNPLRVDYMERRLQYILSHERR